MMIYLKTHTCKKWIVAYIYGFRCFELRKISILIHSDLTPVLNSLMAVFTCSGKMFVFIASVSLGFFVGRCPVSPSSANLRCTVLLDIIISDSWTIWVNNPALFFFYFLNRCPVFSSVRWCVFVRNELFFGELLADPGLYFFLNCFLPTSNICYLPLRMTGVL